MSEPLFACTYRVQLHKDFGFDEVAAIVPYLAELGVTHLYCSPYFQARAGSAHGYDVVDHSSFNSELGGADGFERMHDALSRHGLGHLLDIVPNHMAVTDYRNKWWWDVLTNGRASAFSSYFDIDWDSPEPGLKDKILLPVLGDHYGRILQAGEVRLERTDGDEIVLRYWERSFPLAPGTLEKAGLEPGYEGSLDELNADPMRLQELLELQHYRLAHWRTAARELDYRRFFDVNDLAALRVENPQVFHDVHRFTFRLISSGRLQGLRVDHIDGLADPRDYLERLRDASGADLVVVEKILEPGEALRDDWPVDGTTGYDFLNRVGGLFVDPAGEEPLTRFYEAFSGHGGSLEELTRERKFQVMSQLLASDIERLVALLAEVCERHLRFRDFTRHELRETLRETMAAFEVYRTYVRSEDERPSEEDARRIRSATRDARAHRPDLDGELFEFLTSILLLDLDGELEVAFVTRFQQSSGPVMAKAVEDTVFYNFNRFVALNEVGGNPGDFGLAPDAFHELTSSSSARWPRSLSATSTHDTKRSEDVRARLYCLSEMPDRWERAVTKWFAHNERHRTAGVPSRNDEYLFYQVLVGAWPLEPERAIAYMEKASKEAKSETSWIDPKPAYDEALAGFVVGALADEGFVTEVGDFVSHLVQPGRVNSLAQVLLKLTAPGIADIYQGQEIWDLSLVDPDNRRPVDFEHRRSLLAKLRSGGLAAALSDDENGATKMFVIERALEVRRRLAATFLEPGNYHPMLPEGEKAHHAVAFHRSGLVVTVVPRLVVGLGASWGGTSLELPPGTWVNALGEAGEWHGSILLGELLHPLPVALLTRTDGP